MKKEISLSVQQRSLWLHNMVNPLSDSFNIGFAFRMKGTVNKKLFLDALSSTFERYPALLTTFSKDQEGNPLQHFNGHFEGPEILQIAGDQLKEFLINAYSTPFDLAGDKLNVRTYYIEVPGGEPAFLIVSHHIIFDFFSARILLKELLATYRKYLSGNGDLSMETDDSFESYINKQKEMISGYSESRSFWTDYTRNCPPFLSIPGDHKTLFFPDKEEKKGGILIKTLEEPIITAIQKFAGDHHTSLYNVLFSFFNILLHRYTGQESFVVGTPFLGRERMFLKSIGYFANILPLISRIDDDTNILGYIRQNDQEINLIKRNQFFPFEEIQDIIRNDENGINAPNFNTVFSYLDQGRMEKTGMAHQDESGFFCENINLPSQGDLFEMTLEAKLIDKKLQLNYKYKKTAYSQAFMEAFSNRYTDLIMEGISAPELRINDIESLTKKNFSNQIDAELRDQEGIANLFHHQAQLYPNKCAIISEGNAVSYQLLSHQIKQFSFWIGSRFSIRPKGRIGICIDRSYLQIVAIFSSINLANAYVPIAADLPDDRLRFLIEDSQIDYLLVDQKSYSRMKALTDTVPVIIAEPSFESAKLSDYAGFTYPESRSADAAYVFYTSGTTGTPKGIEVSQDNVLNLIGNQNVVAATESTVFLNVSSFAFDGSVYDFFSALLKGGTLVLPSSNIPTPSEILELAHSHKPNIMFVPTGLFHLLVQQKPEVFDTLKTLIVGGESLLPKYVEKLLAHRPLEIINGYGPTECTVFSTFFKVDKLLPGQQSIPIGKALDGVEVQIMDKHDRILPDFLHGEIVISGKGLSNGYLNPEMVKNSGFGISNGKKRYKTGDIGFKDGNGNIIFVGRKDRQVKHHGHRIELSEIEAVLINHEHIQQAVVSIEQINNNATLIAVVRTDTVEVSEGELKNYLAGKLPMHMVPAHLLMADLGINHNGKLDLKQARTIVANHSFGMKSHDLPENPLQQTVWEIWKKILPGAQIGIYDNFFACGGDSMAAIRLCAEISGSLEKTVSVADIYENQTIHGLCLLLEQQVQSRPKGMAPIKKIIRSQYRINNDQQRINN